MIRSKAWIALVAASLILPSAARTQRSTAVVSPGTDAMSLAGGDGAALDDYFRRARANGFSGAVIVARGKTVLLRRGYGEADWQTGAPSTPTTAFDISSLDKQFIAVGILQLEEAGKLRTGDSLGRFFSYVPADKAGITLHELLTHTSGIPDVYWDEHRSLSRDEFIRWVLEHAKLESAPGTSWSYASANYWILEGIIERASGQDYEHYMRDHVWLPNGMRFTGTLLPLWKRGQVAHLRSFATGTWPFDSLDYGDLLARPPAFRTVLSTADDLYRWYLTLRGEGLLTDSSRRKLLTPVMEKYAYGWNVVPTARGTRLVHHGGAGTGGGMRVTFRWFPDEDVFFCILSGAVDTRFQSDFMAADVEALLFGGAVEFPPATLGAITSASARLAGAYHLPDGARFDVRTRPGGRLLLSTTDARAIAPLVFPDISAPPDSVSQDSVAIRVLQGIATGDYEPLRRALQEGVDFDRYRDRMIEGWRSLAPLGPLRYMTTVHQRSYVRDGETELQSFVALRFEKGDVIMRAVRERRGGIFFNPIRIPPRLDVILAPIEAETYGVWDFRFATGSRLTFGESSGRVDSVTIRGAHARLIAKRTP